VNLDFLTVGGADPGAVARSPMEASARADGARLEVRDGWSVAVGFGSTPEQEAAAAGETAGWADVSHLGKLELHGSASALDSIAAACEASSELGWARRHADAWWCRMTATRLLVVVDTASLRDRVDAAVAASPGTSAFDLTTKYAAMTLTGPLAREVFARFCALDLRPASTPVHALRPGSIGRQPGTVICEDEDRYLFLFGWATGEYMWSIVSDAGRHLGGRPIGIDALAALPARGTELRVNA
jgi:glycine cleavage system aminomethyltransferase T